MDVNNQDALDSLDNIERLLSELSVAGLMDHRNVFEIEDEIIKDIQRSNENQNVFQRSLISFAN